MFFLGVICIIVLWHIASLSYSSFILPDPFTTFQTLFSLVQTPAFWQEFLNTLLKTLLGLGLSLGIGIPIAFLSGLFKHADKFIRPFVLFLQSAPVVSYIAIMMLWFGIGFYTPVFVAFVVLVPSVIINVSEGIRSTDKKLLEMAKVYKIKNSDIMKYIYIPSLIPFMISTLKIVSGTLWKSIVVGEFLAGSKGLGYSLSMARSTLSTDKVFAYTIFLIIMGITYEKLILKINIKPKFKIKSLKKEDYKKEIDAAEIELQNISKNFDKLQVLENINLKFEKSKIYALCGPSGTGKTTLLNIIAKIIETSNGNMRNTAKSMSYIFQDERLIPWLNSKDNIKLINKNIDLYEIETVLKDLKILEKINVFPDELSGGMKKRLNLARGILNYPDLFILDEPFSSLDIKTKHNIIKDFLKLKKKYNFTVIIVSHDPFEISELADEVIFIDKFPANIVKKMNFKNALLRSEKENEKIYLDVKKEIISNN